MNYTLITGASSGIGEALAVSSAKDGANLILVGRDESKLRAIKDQVQNLYSVDVRLIFTDLLAPNAPEHIYKRCLTNGWEVRVLINNAGMGYWGYFDNAPLEELSELIHINQTVVISLCHLFLPMLKKVPYPHILNVASTAAYQPIPFFSVYAATKSFVLSFSRSLRYELKDTKVNVSCLCPGPTDTPFFEKIGFDQINYSKGAIMKSSEVADYALQGLIKKKAVITPGFSNAMGTWFSRHMPKTWMISLIAKFFKPR